MTAAASAIVVLFALGLFVFVAVVFIAPQRADQFLNAFAASLRAHVIEQGVRLVFGAGLIIASPAMWAGGVFRVVGWVIIITSLALLALPWHWHNRFAARVIPTVIRLKAGYALLCGGFAAVLLFALLKGPPPG